MVVSPFKIKIKLIKKVRKIRKIGSCFSGWLFLFMQMYSSTRRTTGTCPRPFFKVVRYLEGLHNALLLNWAAVGPENSSVIEKCPLFRGVRYERFHCSYTTNFFHYVLYALYLISITIYYYSLSCWWKL